MAASKTPATIMTKTDALRSALLALAGAAVFGAVALIANFSHSWNQIAIAVSGQMAMCFAMTFTTASMMQAVFKIPHHPIMKFVAASAGVGFFSLGLMAIIHIVIGTPEVVATILGATAVSLFYYIAFPLHLLRAHYGELDQNYRTRPGWNQNWGLRWFANPYNAKEYTATVRRNLTGPTDQFRALTDFCPRQFTLNKPEHNRNRQPSVKPLKIGFLGDIMPMKGKRWQLSEDTKTFFHGIDYLVANFEGSLGNGPYSLMCQRHHVDILQDLQAILPANRIVLSIANNHAADFDYDQFQYTTQTLEAQGFIVVGSKDKPNILLKENINIVAATQWTNQHHGYLSFLENAEQHTEKGQCNILFPHWGYEMEYFPRPDWIQKAKQLIEQFDLIVGHHSHVPGPVHIYKDSQGRDKTVVYSLGDSATGMGFKHYQRGLMLIMDFEVTTDSAAVIHGHWQASQLCQQPRETTLHISQEYI
jgi:hypothetical protein